MKKTKYAIAAVTTAATLLPMLQLRNWWVRVFDFPRMQVAGLAAGGLGLHLASRGRNNRADHAAAGLLGFSLIYQAAQMAPYTRLWPRQVQDARSCDASRRITLLMANVLMTNRDSARFRQIVEQAQPDIVLAVETNRWWLEELRPLSRDFPHTVFCPLENTYGMLLFTRLELLDPQVGYVVEQDIPSIHTRCRLRSGDEVDLRFLHPRPPMPQEAEDSAPRDAELLLVGAEVKQSSLPRIVAGDLNDVAWSRTTKIFQKISGLLDPRVGRGFYNTFHAMNPLLRFSLDHVFHSNEFRLARLEVLPAFGSDHFPVLITLSFEPDAPAHQPEPEPSAEDVAEKHDAAREAAEGS